MKITKNQLQTIIREEYVKVMFESHGRKISTSQAKDIAENLDEGFFGDVFKSIKSASKAGADSFARSRKDASKKDIEAQEQKNEEALTKTQDQLKKEIIGIRMKAKDKLKSNGFVGDDGDISVIGVDLFNAILQEIVSESQSSKKVASREKNVRSGGMGTYRRAG